MDQKLKSEIVVSIQDFKLPKYHEIPDSGLYLEQVARYISDYLAPLEHITLTGSMISNYVKKKLIANPIRKQYNREQIAYLFFIAVAKPVLSMDEIALLISLQKKAYSSETAYNYFCSEFENILFFVFGIKGSVDEVGVDATDEKQLLRNLIISVIHKLFLNKHLSRLQAENE